MAVLQYNCPLITESAQFNRIGMQIDQHAPLMFGYNMYNLTKSLNIILLKEYTVNSHLTDALNSGHTQCNGQYTMYQLKLIYFMYLRTP